MKFDILLPLYRPRDGWEEPVCHAVSRIAAALSGKGDVHLYITNDGAPPEYYPQTALDRVNAAVGGNLHFLPYEKNRGKGYSLRHLVQHADGDHIVYTDGDFPFGSEAVIRAFELLAGGADVVMGRRSAEYAEALCASRKMLSGGAKLLNRLLLGLPPELQDTQAGLKGFNRKGRDAFLKTTVDTFIFDTEFILLAKQSRLRIVPFDITIREGLHFSAMGAKVMFRELLHFCRILWQIRICRKYRTKKVPQLLLSFDIEEFDLPQEYGAAIDESDKYAIAAEGTREILKVLERTKIRATFFTTGNFAEKHPDIISKMAADGHEIASHGMDHSAFEVSHLARSREVLAEISGQKITGFRMARLAPVDKAEIQSAGYAYESSLNPVWLPGRYCNLLKPLRPFREKCGILQLPVSAVPCCRFPLFWLSFKNLPLPLYKFATATAVKLTGYYNMYSHPWEYSARAAEKQWQIPAYVVKHAGKAQSERLENLINFLKKHGEFVTFQEYISRNCD
ncbi:MAG: DUF3473 domain-containing protein [Lentisphaerae bacterium]|nr:DUF3473 domain-containing protein [Lentisphaerota bacterium]